MTDESVEFKVVPRGGLMLLLTRTPFNLVLRGCTVADLQAASSAATVPRQFKLKVRDRMLILRKYGGPEPLATGWSVKTRMEDTADGVRLTGHQCYLSDRIYFAAFAISSLFLLGLATWIAINEGLGSGGVMGCTAVAMLPGLLALLIVVLQPRTVARQQERAEQILAGILEAG